MVPGWHGRHRVPSTWGLPRNKAVAKNQWQARVETSLESSGLPKVATVVGTGTDVKITKVREAEPGGIPGTLRASVPLAKRRLRCLNEML